MEKKLNRAEYYNRNSRVDTNSFIDGETVLVQNKFTENWREGTIIKKLPEPRSYLVLDEK